METPDPAPAAKPEITDDEVSEESIDEVADDVQQRLWLKAATGSAQALAALSVDDCRVRYAIDQAVIAACERIGRLCKSDMEM